MVTINTKKYSLRKTLILFLLTLIMIIFTIPNNISFCKYVLNTNVDNIDLDVIIKSEKIEYSWDEIYEIIVAGEASEYLNIGDVATVKVNGEDKDVVIIGMNVLNEPGVTFMFKDPISYNVIDDSGSNSQTWENSKMRNVILPEILEQMENKDYIKEVVKSTFVSQEGQDGTVTSSSILTLDKLFLLSRGEVFDDTTMEGSMYQYFEKSSRRILGRDGYEDETGLSWWLRSASSDDDTSYYVVGDNGELSSGVSNSNFYVFPAFVIGEVNLNTLDLLPPFELPENLVSGESVIISEMPNIEEMTANAIANTPENTTFYGWLVENEVSQQIFMPEAFEFIIEDTFSYDEEIQLRITPIYEIIEEDKEFKAIINTNNLINIEILNLENNEISFEKDIVLELSVIENYELPETIEILIDETSYTINTNGENDLEFISFVDNIITISSELAVNEITEISIVGEGVEKLPEEEEQEEVNEENTEDPENTESEEGESTENADEEVTSPDDENSSTEKEPVEPDNGETEVPEDEITEGSEPEEQPDNNGGFTGGGNSNPDNSINEGDGEQNGNFNENITDDPSVEENPDTESGEGVDENILSAFINLTGIKNITIKDLNKQLLENNDELVIENDELVFFISPKTDYELPEIISLSINDNEYEIDTVEENKTDGIEFINYNGKLIISSLLLTEKENIVAFYCEGIEIEKEEDGEEEKDKTEGNDKIDTETETETEVEDEVKNEEENGNESNGEDNNGESNGETTTEEELEDNNNETVVEDEDKNEGNNDGNEEIGEDVIENNSDNNTESDDVTDSEDNEIVEDNNDIENSEENQEVVEDNSSNNEEIIENDNASNDEGSENIESDNETSLPESVSNVQNSTSIENVCEVNNTTSNNISNIENSSPVSIGNNEVSIGNNETSSNTSNESLNVVKEALNAPSNTTPVKTTSSNNNSSNLNFNASSVVGKDEE